MTPHFANINKLCDIVRETSFDIHRFFRSGHLEKVYENSLTHRLRKQAIHVEQQFELPVLDEDGTLVGDYYADLFIDYQLIVELKAARMVSQEKCRTDSGLPSSVKNRDWIVDQLRRREALRQEIHLDHLTLTFHAFSPSSWLCNQ